MSHTLALYSAEALWTMHRAASFRALNSFNTAGLLMGDKSKSAGHTRRMLGANVGEAKTSHGKGCDFC